MPKVLPPHVRLEEFGTLQSSAATTELVQEWELQPGSHYGLGHELFVLSIWTQNRDKHPLRVCLSPPAVAQIAKGFTEKLDEYLLGEGDGTND